MGIGAATSQRKETFEDSEGFVEKFKPKKTTDDCYTPPEVYEAIKDWACVEYGIDPARVVRPFYPGGDYKAFDYSGGAVVLDNPPFSIESEILGFYLDRSIPFFLFCPTLTAFGSASTCMRCCHVICDCKIVYENGAVVPTSFVTSYDEGVIARTAPDLTRAVNAACERISGKGRVELPKYEYPDHIVTAAMMQAYAKRGVDFRVMAGECCRVSRIDANRSSGIYGGGCSCRIEPHRNGRRRTGFPVAMAGVRARWCSSYRPVSALLSLSLARGTGDRSPSMEGLFSFRKLLISVAI